MDWLEQVTQKLKRSNQILFTKDSLILQDLASLLCHENRRVITLWAFDLASGSVDLLKKRYPGEDRPTQALCAAQDWAAGRIKMREAQRAILNCHALAKQLQRKEDISLCHAIGQACSVVHTTRHALGYPMYDLTAMVHQFGVESCTEAIIQRKQEYMDKLFYWNKHADSFQTTWADFMLK